MIGSANPPPRSDKPYPQITLQELLCAVGVSPSKTGCISALAPFRRLRACTQEQGSLAAAN
ncbi:hypothetical protein FMJ64_24025 [Klebsiella variicola]|nr:hypothetical protein [Klebsiella variicola]